MSQKEMNPSGFSALWITCACELIRQKDEIYRVL